MNSLRREAILEKLSAKASILEKVVGRVAGAPVRSVGGTLKNLLVGKPVKGAPWYAKKRIGTDIIDRTAFNKMKAKGKKVWKTTSPEGKPVYLKSKYGPGGAAGWAMKHPVMAGVGTLGAATLMSGPKQPNINIYNQQPAQEQPKTGPRFVNWG